MKNFLQSAGLVALGIVAGVVLGNILIWRGCDGEPGTSDTTTVIAPVTPPPVHVTPNPAPAVVDGNEKELALRVDSLLSAGARERARGLAQAESLAVVVAYKDSLLRVRSFPTRSEQRIEALSPNGIRISGTLRMIHEPIERVNLARVKLDSVQIPVKIVHTTEVRTETNTYVVVGAAVVGVVLGAWLDSRLNR